MVALALMPNPHETDKWEYFDIPFDYQRYGKMIDNAKLAKGEYKISIISLPVKTVQLLKVLPEVRS